MRSWSREIWCCRKSNRSIWKTALYSTLLAAGCESVDRPDPNFERNPRTVASSLANYPPRHSTDAQHSTAFPERGILAAQFAEPQGHGISAPDRKNMDFQHTASGTSTAPVEANSIPNATVPALQLDLTAALHLAGVDNPTINLAREQIREALGQQLNARVLLVPNLNVGGSYHYNNGPVQASTGQILPVSDQALYLGFGAGAVGAGSVVYPGAWLSAQLGDAAFEPLAARENVASQRANSAAVQNAIVGDVAVAYLNLAGCEGRLEVLRRADREGSEVVRLTSEFAQAGQGRPADANRARGYEELVWRQRLQAQEEVEVASVRLCRLLNVDPSNRLRTAGTGLETFRLIPEHVEPDFLLAQALQNRPELATLAASVREAQIRVRQEKLRPFLPSISVGISSGAFGGGSNLVPSGFSPLSGRTDIDAMAVWNLQNLGFGNRARVREANAVVGQRLAEYETAKNVVRREVAEAYAEVHAAMQQLEIARRAVVNANDGFQLDLARIKGGQGVGPNNRARPIELLDSFVDLLRTREELVATIARFDIAQFRLFVAVGSNPLNAPEVSQSAPVAASTGPATIPKTTPVELAGSAPTRR